MKYAPFTSYEVSPCVTFNAGPHSGKAEAYNTLSGAEKAAEQRGGFVIWTLYGWSEETFTQSIADFNDEGAALELLSRITRLDVPGPNGERRFFHVPKTEGGSITDDPKHDALVTHALIVRSDHYRCVAVSTGHLTAEDNKALSELTFPMLMKREYGYFVKLYEEPESNTYPSLSLAFNEVLRLALRAGYRMVEFDRDAPAVKGLPVFEW